MEPIRLHLVDGKRVAIITSNTHTYNVRFIKSGKFMEIHKSFVKTINYIPKPKKPKDSPAEKQLTLNIEKMTKEDFLKLKGYNPAEWDIMSAETSQAYLPERGAINNMYEIKDRKDVALFGKGCYIIKKKWMFDTIDVMDAEGRSGNVKKPMEKTVETPSVPPPPPVPTPVVVDLPPLTEKIEAPKVVDNFLCDKYHFTNEACDEQCETCKEKESAPPVKKNVNELYEESHRAIDAAIEARKQNTYSISKEERIKIVESLDLVQDGPIFKSKDGSCGIDVLKVNTASDQEFTKSIDGIKDFIAKSKTSEKIAEIVKQSGVPQGNVFIGSIPPITPEEAFDPITTAAKEEAIKRDDLEIDKRIEESAQEEVNENKDITELEPHDLKYQQIMEARKLELSDGVGLYNDSNTGAFLYGDDEVISYYDISKIHGNNWDKKVQEISKEVAHLESEAKRLAEFKATEAEVRKEPIITEEMKTPVVVEGVIDEDPLSVELEEERIENLTEKKESLKSNPNIDLLKTNMVCHGFFANLNSFGFQQLNITINSIGNGKLNVILKPVNFSGDPAFDKIPSLVLNGTVEELDNEFFKAISLPLSKTEQAMSNAKAFMDELAAQEKETKAKKAAGDKIKAAVDKAKKVTDDKEFKKDDVKSLDEGLKVWNEVIELDSKNKVADKTIKELQEAKNKLTNTLL